jgi:hypothetical protein
MTTQALLEEETYCLECGASMPYPSEECVCL